MTTFVHAACGVHFFAAVTATIGLGCSAAPPDADQAEGASSSQESNSDILTTSSRDAVLKAFGGRNGLVLAAMVETSAKATRHYRVFELDAATSGKVTE